MYIMQIVPRLYTSCICRSQLLGGDNDDYYPPETDEETKAWGR